MANSGGPLGPDLPDSVTSAPDTSDIEAKLNDSLEANAQADASGASTDQLVKSMASDMELLKAALAEALPLLRAALARPTMPEPTLEATGTAKDDGTVEEGGGEE